MNIELVYLCGCLYNQLVVVGSALALATCYGIWPAV